MGNQSLHYYSLIAGNILAAIVLAIIMFAMLMYKEHRKSSRYLFIAIAVEFLFLLGDAASWYNISVNALPIWIARIAYFVSYNFGFLVLIPFSLYSKTYIEEKAPVKKWVYPVPVAIALLSFIISIVSIASGSVYGVIDGKMQAINGSPVVIWYLQLAMIIYLPIVAITKVKQIGVKSVMLLGLFGVLPAILIFVNYDFTGIGAAISLAIVYILLQCDYSSEREKRKIELEELNKQLAHNHAQLEEFSAEQEAQLEEIHRLYTQKEYLSYSCKTIYPEVYLVDLAKDEYKEITIDDSIQGEQMKKLVRSGDVRTFRNYSLIQGELSRVWCILETSKKPKNPSGNRLILEIMTWTVYLTE